ncbi:MAG: hypothetical protein RQ729_01465 [Wenzhouxiangellaceae bacterium]|nr:hypothetical protein [Wenzhouxiangellaceae bacterium]
MLSRFTAIALLTLLTLPASAQLRALDTWSDPDATNADATLGFGSTSRAPAILRGLPGNGERPRLSVSLSPESGRPLDQRFERPSFSWSLEAWEMNTASLAHIQCNRATRSLGSVVAEDCRFVSEPLPETSTGLVQVQGQWMAAPGVTIGGGVYAGTSPIVSDPNVGRVALQTLGSGVEGPRSQAVQGVNLNLNFGMHISQIGNLLVDLQLDRYRRRGSLGNDLQFATLGALGLQAPATLMRDDYGTAAALGLGWQGRSFSADVTGNYQELPLWLGEELDGEGFRSFDIEFSWRAPINASISVGVTNVLDRLPNAASMAGDSQIEDTVEGIYGRIPYVRYKHDL